MIPLHFGSRARQIFGVYSRSRGDGKRRGVVICNPWGTEALRAHRSLKLLADTLSASGLDVLRFDYFGTGDSWGDGTEVRLAGARDDVRRATDELRVLAGVDRVDLVGLRFGALVAAGAGGDAEGPGRIVLWDPVSGPDFLAELFSTRLRVNGSPSEYGGFPLPDPFVDELSRAPLSGLPGDGPKVLLVFTRTHGNGVEHELRASEVTVEVAEGPACWIEERDFGAGAVPVELVQKVVGWLA